MLSCDAKHILRGSQGDTFKERTIKNAAGLDQQTFSAEVTTLLHEGPMPFSDMQNRF